MSESKRQSDAQWRALLDDHHYDITRNKGTEKPFTGAYWETTEPGLYRCYCCKTPLFWSDAKYDAGCGWPSFFQSIPDAVATAEDLSHGRVRTEILCAACDAHLGHVFDDGPKPTGHRYCVNSASVALDTEAKLDGTKPINTKPTTSAPNSETP
jgi:peptide-methionine (R)-S-oxide reductase